MSLISAFLSHAIWLQRNATSEVNELRQFIEKMLANSCFDLLIFIPHSPV